MQSLKYGNYTIRKGSAKYAGYLAPGWVSASGLRTATAAAGPTKWAAEHLKQCTAGLHFRHANDHQGCQVSHAQQAAHELPQEQTCADENIGRSKSLKSAGSACSALDLEVRLQGMKYERQTYLHLSAMCTALQQ